MSTSQSQAGLLVELFVEELPPKALKRLGEVFAGTLATSLKSQGLAAADAVVTAFASPRRLAAHLSAVSPKAADKATLQKLMPVAVALDAAGAPTAALLKKLAALGADASAVPNLKRAPDGKAEALFLDATVAGATLAEGLQRALEEALARLPIPKVMSYQLADGWSSVHFVRPAHGLVAVHGADVVPVSVLGLSAGNVTHGHRFEATRPAITLRHAGSYAEQLASEGAVIAGFDERRAEIARQLAERAGAEGLQPIDDPALLDEVTALVERPNVLLCRFDEDFLAVPQECLILTMKANQKYFPLLDAAGRLTHKFLVVSNIRPEDPTLIVGGNERVVRPRLADARFFFDQDRKKTLESRVAALDKVVYHNKLGTQGERTLRVRRIAQAIGRQLDGEALAASAERAALLAKADLLTDMVGEFPELQGVMGGYYARHDGETEAVALAIEDHYRPRFAGDDLPRNPTGLAVALADKLETLAGLFGVGQVPTGDKDPFALRRHALGVIRMLEGAGTRLPLDAAIDIAMTEPRWPDAWRNTVTAGDAVTPLRTALLAFFGDRLSVTLRDRGFSAQEVAAVLADDKFVSLADVPDRLAAVRAFAALPEAESLAAANKRVANILRKSEHAADSGSDPQLRTDLLKEPAEHALLAALERVELVARPAFDRRDYTASLVALAALKHPVDAFFDAVMVNAEDAALRRNRLALLARLHAAMNRVADLSRLAA